MNQELEQFKDPLPVLDKGFVRLVDVMGDDSSVVQAARVSYGKGTKTVREDRGLIRYLMRHRHTTPLEMCEIKLHVKVPMDCWRQWIRHRTANVNEYSTRYSEAIDARQETLSYQWRSQSKNNKQGSGAVLPEEVGTFLTAREGELHKFLVDVYQERLDSGVAREQARKDLPLSTYTEAYWKIDLHNLFHFLSLRQHSHAQKEIREFADAVALIVKAWVPLCYEAYVDYKLHSSSLSRMEGEYLRDLVAACAAIAPNVFQELTTTETMKDYGLSKREINELKVKLGLK